MKVSDPVVTEDFWHIVGHLFDLIAPLKNLQAPCDHVSNIRKAVRVELKKAHEFLTETMVERDAYFILFALVAHIDEIVYVHLEHFKSNQSFEPFQKELFSLSRAGDLFYGYVDSFRGRNDIPALVYEVYFFCLQDGFKGKFATTPANCEMYRRELKAYINPKSVETENLVPNTPISPYYKPSPWMYYASLFLAYILFNVCLSLIPLNIRL